MDEIEVGDEVSEIGMERGRTRRSTYSSARCRGVRWPLLAAAAVAVPVGAEAEPITTYWNGSV